MAYTLLLINMNKLVKYITILLLLLGLAACSSTVRFSNNGHKENTSTKKGNDFEYSGSSDLRNKIINEAKQWIGTPYQYGGESKSGADCSGFVMSVYQNSGIDLPRTSQQQFNYVQLIDNHEREAGDLVFFKRNNKIFHVGIYLGDNYMIHASSSKGVIIQSIADDYFDDKYAGSGRIIK
jgi:cell wall-associated NlpC family hydrolase